MVGWFRDDAHNPVHRWQHVGHDRLGKPSNAAKPDAGPWDEFAQSIIGVMAAKNDVLVSVESGPFKADTSRDFVEKAIENLAR